MVVSNEPRCLESIQRTPYLFCLIGQWIYLLSHIYIKKEKEPRSANLPYMTRAYTYIYAYMHDPKQRKRENPCFSKAPSTTRSFTFMLAEPGRQAAR